MAGVATPVQDLRTAFAKIPVREEAGEVIISPATTDEVSAVLRYCHEHELPISILGAGTKRCLAGETQAQLTLETTRLAGVREHPWQDLTATVGAGTPWAEMQRVLAAHGQFVALDPLWPERATVGGVLAINDSGALRLRYGSARDLVIGMTIVLADGTIARTGGKVVKNVAGYDLHKLMIGAFGTLAVMTQVTFRLHPLPANRVAYTLSTKDAEAVGRLTAAITTSHLNPEAMQVRTSAEGFALDLLFAVAPEVLGATENAVAALGSSCGLRECVRTNDLNVFRRREVLYDLRPCTILKATMLPTAMPAAMGELARAGASVVGYPLGILYAAIASEQVVPPSFRQIIAASGGSVTVLGNPTPPTALMREIKRQFDPNRILNRGAMGGI